MRRKAARPGSLILGAGCSTLLHGGSLLAVVISSFLGGTCSKSEPVIRQTIEVSMVSLPKSRTNMPDRATRAPRPQGVKQAPKKPTAASPAPEPVKQSDLVINQPEPKPGPKNTPDAPPEPVSGAQSRAQLLAALERQELLEALTNAPIGEFDQVATDPNSQSEQSFSALGSGARGDPEFARYIETIQKLFKEHFTPLVRDQGLMTTVRIEVDPTTGEITDFEVAKSSGNASFDAAANRAVANIEKLPLPPPKYLPLVAGGFEVQFVPP